MKENIQEIPAIAGGTPVRDTKISYGHQYLDEADYQAVLDVLKNGPLTCGPKIGELEDKLCRITGARHAAVSYTHLLTEYNILKRKQMRYKENLCNGMVKTIW